MAVSANWPLDQSTSDISIDSSIHLGIGQLIEYMGSPFLVAFKIPFQQVRKKEEPEDDKHDEKLDQYNAPEFFSPGHVPESLKIESENLPQHKIKMTNKLIN